MRCGAICNSGRCRCGWNSVAGPTLSTALAKKKFTVAAVVRRCVNQGRSTWPQQEQRVADEARDIVDWVHFEKSRAELGPGFIRILTYFREDGTKSVAEIEQAMHS